MKLLTFKTSADELRVGAFLEHPTKSQDPSHGIHDITHLYPTVLQLISEADSLSKIHSEIQDHAPSVDLSEITVVAPIPEPRRNVFCVGWNYLKHFNEGIGHRGDYETELPDHPTFFTKATLTVSGPGECVPYDPAVTEKLDYEAEIAVIIGQRGKNIPASEAMNYVFGVTLANDISARDLQRLHGGQWVKGKSLDGTCPLGPFITTIDEVPLLEQLSVRSYVNGELRQNATMRQLIFNVPQLIEELSRGMTLLPGDILLTGTPDGIGSARSPQVFLKPGDEIMVQSDELGELKSVISRDGTSRN